MMRHNNLLWKWAICRLLFPLLIFAVGMTKGYAYDFSTVCATGQTLYYNITDATNHYVQLTCPTSYGWSGYTQPTGEITLPSSVDYNGITYTITSIGERAFYSCNNLTGSLTIPNSVTTIGNEAFYFCYGFTGSLIIPNSVTTIGNNAFGYCMYFTGSLTIPNSVITIGNQAFYYCQGFTGSLIIPNSVTTIGNEAFCSCSGFTGSLTISNSVTTIGDEVFSRCSGFTGDLVIPNSVIEIGWNAFSYCSGFTGCLTIGNSVTTISSAAFAGCTGIEAIVVASGNPNYDSRGNCNAIIETSTNTLISGCKNSLIPNSVVKIGDNAFSGCSSLTGSLIIPNSVTTIGNGAFSGCSGLTGSLTIGSSVNIIGDWAFNGCSGFTGSLTIPNSVTEIGYHAFYNCSGFTGGLSIPNSVVSIGSGAFYGCSGFSGGLTIPNSVSAIESDVFSGCNGFTGNLIIPNFVTSIGSYAFSGCSGFTGNLNIPNSVTSIASGAFSGCSGFDAILVGAGNLNYDSRENCNAIIQTNSNTLIFGCKNSYIPNSVTAIGERAFYNCSGLIGSLTIPNSVTTIGSSAFYNCSGLTGSLTIPNSVTTIGSSAFFNCSGFTGSLTIPNSLTMIDWEVFSGCSGFTGSLTIPNSVTLIGPYAFYDCNGFTGSLNIPNSVTSIGYMSFFNCNSITAITSLAETPPSIGNYAFYAMNHDILVTVPCGTLNAYQSASGWSDFAYIYEDCGTTYSIFLCAQPTEGGVVEGGGEYEYGDECTVIALANEGYSFICWSENGTVVSTSDTLSFTVTESRVLVANFTLPIELHVYAEYYPDVNDEQSPYVRIFWGEESFCNGFSYNFDDSALPDGWTIIDGGSPSGYGWKLASLKLGSGFGHNGSNDCFISQSYDNNYGVIYPDNYLISEQVDITEGSTFSFWACAQDLSYSSEHFGVFVSLGSNSNPDDFQEVQSWTLSPLRSGEPLEGRVIRGGNRVQTLWHQYTVDLSDFVGTGYIAIRHYNCYDQYMLVVDDVEFCNGPQQANRTLYNYNVYRANCDGTDVTLIAENVTETEYIDSTWMDLAVGNYKYGIHIGETAWSNCIEKTYYSIIATADPFDSGTVVGGGSYTDGSTCTLTATANASYTFVNWTENGEVVSAANPYTFTVTGNRNLVANFTISGGDEHEYVDLGLPSGLLWATCNVGASSPEDYGDCFAWGETQPKDTYNWNNYLYCNGSNNTLTKYCNDANYGYNGFTDTLTILQPSDDAATANWGAYWHTPTKEEWQELYQNTTHIWTTQSGVNGQLFTASNGNSLFLPATAGRYGYYWLSSVNTDSPSNAWELYFSSGNYCGTDYYDRYYGQSVRAVRSPMFIIDVTANPTEGGEITGGGDYQGGANCTLTATANAGYTFVNWTENGEVVSTENPYTFTVIGNRSLVANFTVDDDGVPVGAINGKFTINFSGGQVYFSQGNLQYIGSASTPYWKFADNQWDYLGNNGQGNNSPTVDCDLFGWGTSGYNHGANCYQPWNNSDNYRDYYAYGSFNYNLFDQTGQAEWGYNAISNGGNQVNSNWKVLTHTEWNYLIYNRYTESGCRWAKGTVNGVKGIILLPDDWNTSYYELNNTNSGNANYSSNIITSVEWTSMLEVHGAVFLPAAGYRYGTVFANIEYSGNYWTSVSCYNHDAYCMSFNSGAVYPQNRNSRHYGCSVRLICPTETCTITAVPNPAEGGTTDGGGSFAVGQSCTLTAVPNEGYYFTNWKENGIVISTSATYSFTVTESKTLVANFSVQSDVPNGIINGFFTVNSDGGQVCFSKGNLQYNKTNGEWSFMEHQYDLVETNYQNMGYDYADQDMVSLFGWGTSGYNHGAVCYQPWSTSSNNSDYYAYNDYVYSLYDLTGQAEWGYNAISNGDNQENSGWHTLDRYEWNYLFETRNTNSGIRFAKGTVNDVNGVILLPDDWASSIYTLNNTNDTEASFSSNSITEVEWMTTLEPHGAVFLPAAGTRTNASAHSVNSWGIYWSGSSYDSEYVNVIYFHNDGMSYHNTNNTYTTSNRYYGRSVRLVRSASSMAYYGINTISVPANGGIVTGGGTYPVGSVCTLVATANPGYVFVNWIEDGEIISTDANYSFIVTGIRTIKAVFSVQVDVPVGAINGYYTINEEGEQVCFSHGNLQYNKSTSKWSFMEHQYDMVETNYQNIGENYANQNIISLFGWGTSGYNHGAVCYQPWKTDMNNQNYLAYGDGYYRLFDMTGQAEWGYNAITNGGNQENIGWRTLTNAEWYYLLNTRITASGVLWTQGTVNGVKGVIILPDNWDTSIYLLNNANDGDYASNIISAMDWTNIFETNGAVFLPAAGYRYGTSVSSQGYSATYWSSWCMGPTSAYGVTFSDGRIDPQGGSNRYVGCPVRLVRTIQGPTFYGINAIPNPAEGGTITGDGNYIEGQTCTLTATPNEGYQFLYWTEDEDVVSMEATYSFTVTDNRTLVANFVAYNPSGELQVFAEYYPDSSNVFSPYVKVYWTGITASRYNIYRAFCYSDDYELIAENVTDTLYIDYAWFNLPLNNYKYGVSVEDGRGGTSQIHWNNAPVATNEVLIDASTIGNPYSNNGSLGMPLRVNYNNGWLHYDNGNYIKSIGSGLGMLHWGVKFPSETLASYAGNQLKKVAVYMRSGNNEILNISVHVGGTTAPGMSVCSMDFDVSGYNNGFVEFALPEPIFITGTENIWITLSQAGNYPAQASPDSGEPNGRWISLNGQTWMDMANYGLDGSWMIRGYVGDDPAIYWSNCIDKTHYSITATANPTEGGTVTGGGAYSQGTTCTLTAMANSGYHFANWTENGVVVSTNANYSFTVTRSRNLVAHFTTNSQVCAINVSTNPSYGGSANGGGYYYYGTICTVNALANSGYIFTNWTENGTVVSIDASYTFTVTGSRNLVANFTAIPQFCTINVYANPSYGGSVTGTGTYAYGINCTLTATATTGYIFLNWTENGTVVSTSANYTFTVTRNRNLVANFTADLPYYGINAVPNPNEGGTITGTGIYMEGQNCTLKAFANSGYTFINWTKDGVVVSTNATYRFVVTEAANYVANFELRSYAITVTASPTEGGTVAGAGTYYYGATCTVTATANSGYFFANWTLNGRVVSYSAEYIFTVTGNRNLVANFVTNPQVCTISTFTNPSYGGTAIGAGYYYTGASCTLTATANSGYAFVNWTENNVVVSTEAEYTFTVTGDRNLAANFTPVGTISAIANPNYGGSITGGGTYQYGTRCTLRATANSGYLFVNWTENGVTVSTNAKYSFTVMGNRNLVANFTVNNNPQVYLISVFANPSYGGSITGSNTYAYGTSCTVTATANSGYTFLNWTENGTVVSTNADYTFTVTGNRTLLANFMADTQLYTINTFANPSYGGTVSGDGGFYYGSSCTVTATANNGYTFVNWTENGTVVSFNANYTFTVKRNRNLVANFSANMEYFGINATPNPIEGGTITGAGIYIEGQTCTLTASPSFGYVFVNWTENGTVVSFDASYTFTVTGSRSLVANFADDMSFVGINANPNPIEGGAIMGAGLYLPGQTCILMAVANSGYIFVNWTENGTVVSDNAECTFIVTGSRNLVANFDIQPSVTQTIQLSQGWNWCSFNVEITLDDLKAALVAALPGTAINIKSQTQNVMYQNGRWTGSLTALNLTRMYMISVGNNCEISLEGQPINPSTLTVTINSGVNWIAFPYSESMTVTDFFGSFPANNDQVKSQSQNARYQGNRWAGQLSTLMPGKGYMYISNTQGTRIFTYPANAK